MKATKDILEFDRWDRAALYLLLAGAAIAAAVTTVVTPVISWFRGTALDVPMTSRVVVPELDAVGTAHGDGSYLITVATPSTASRVLDLVHGLLVLAVVILGLYLAWSVIRRIAAGKPFATGQVGRLRGIAGLLVIAVPALMIGQSFVTVSLLDDVDLGGLPATTSITGFIPIMTVGLAVAALAEAFKVGSRLQGDVEGLV